MTEEQRQRDKEQAVLVALRQGTALIRKGLEVHGMKTDGATKLISKSSNYETVWADALKELTNGQ